MPDALTIAASKPRCTATYRAKGRPRIAGGTVCNLPLKYDVASGTWRCPHHGERMTGAHLVAAQAGKLAQPQGV